MKAFLINLIKAYQGKVSPKIKPDCRFIPTCSEYAVLVLQKHGLLVALSKAIIRILKCNPLTSKGTIDLP